MATGSTGAPYNFPYPLSSDPVNVHGDMQALAEALNAILPEIGVPYFTHPVKNTSGATINIGDPVYVTGFSSKTTIAKSDSLDINTFPVFGLAKAEILDGADGIVVTSGMFDEIDTTGFLAGSILYVNENGGLTKSQPVTGSGAVGIVLKEDTNGIIMVGQPKGNGTWVALKAGLA